MDWLISMFLLGLTRLVITGTEFIGFFLVVFCLWSFDIITKGTAEHMLIVALPIAYFVAAHSVEHWTNE